MENNLVTMNVSPDIIKPIVETKIKEAIAAALGGSDSIVKHVVEQVLHSRVNDKGNVSSYSSDNKYTWLDIVITNQIKDIVRETLQEQIKDVSGNIKKEIEKFLQSKKGSSNIASLLCASMADSIGSNYNSYVEVKFSEK